MIKLKNWQSFFFLVMLIFLQNLPLEGIPLILQVKNREIVVNGKKTQVFQVIQPNGVRGLFLQKGEQFEVILENHIAFPTGIHWHGLILPNSQDGVPYVTQAPIPSGGKYPYHFPLVQSGTFWMHAHYGLQEQQLLAAPLILYDPKDPYVNRQEVILFLSDFSFRNPLAIFKELKSRKIEHVSTHKVDDLNDVKYDAFLTNWRTLSDPEVVTVVPEKEVRLRIINGSSSSNFFIQLGKLKGEVIATDGSDCHPIVDSQFELGVAQRLDILVKLPSEEGIYPIFAQGEGLEMRTGLLLATPGLSIPSLSEKAEKPMRAISYRQETLLKAKNPLAKKGVDRRLMVNLEGNMAKYIWAINGKAWPDYDPLMVKEGERVELIFVNHTMMAHPMHLHGHVFQVKEINGELLEGAMRDTVLVLPKSTVKVQFDANNPGNWPLHCHNLYHQYAGMMTTLNYIGFKGLIFTKAEIEKERAD